MVDQRRFRERFAQSVLELPRITRILIAGVFALAIVLALSPLIDEIYIRFFYTPQTAIVPSLVAAGLGLLMYFVGWQLIVGTVGEDNPLRPAIFWYFVVGFLALFIVGLWLLRLITLGSIS